MLIDTHAHLNMTPLYERWQDVLAEAHRAGVTHVVVPGASIETSKRGVAIAQQAPAVWAAVGIHPEELCQETSIHDVKAMIHDLAQLIGEKKVVAIGECGLDYHYQHDTKDMQRKLFAMQVALAKKHSLPLIIHTREKEAIEEAAEIVGDYQRCVYHCFSGDEDPGTFVGVGGTITFRGNEALAQVVASIPLERLLLETDAPWLAPTPVRGTTNVPANVTIAALKLSELKGVPVSQIMKVTSENACRLFGIAL